LWRVRQRLLTSIVTNIRERRAALHRDVVRVAGMLAMRSLRHTPRVAVVARRLVVVVRVVSGLLVVDIACMVNVLLGDIVVIEFIQERTPGARGLRVGRVVVLGVVPHLGGGLDCVGLGDDAVLFAGIVDGGIDGNVELVLNVGRGVMQVVRIDRGPRGGRAGVGGGVRVRRVGVELIVHW
jgi:hypothetical protein